MPSTPLSSRQLFSRSMRCPRITRLLSCGMVAVGLWGGTVQAVNYYWDDTATADGTSATPNGTWGTDAFFNSSSTGSSTGTFITAPAITDLVQFVARASATDATSGSGTYTVDVTGTQNALGMVFRQTGTVTIGATVGSGTINLGASGIDNSARSVVTGVSTSGGVIINSNLVLQANQTWMTNNVTASTPPFTIAGNTTGTGNLTLTQGANRPFTVTGGLNYTGSLSFAGGNGNSSYTISGNTGTTGSIGATVNGVNVGAGTSNLVIFNRALGNNYVGATTISSGKLRLDNTSGSATGTSAIVLNGGSANATLAGVGISTGMLTVTAGSRIAPGTVSNGSNFGSAGTLTVGTTTLTSVNFDYDLAATAAGTNDRLVTGTLTLGGTMTFNITAASAANVTLQTAAPYTLIDSANTAALDLSGTTINTVFNGALAGAYTAAYSSNATGDLLVTFTTAVPEPSTYALMAVGLGLFCWSQRKRLRGMRA